MLDLPDKLSLLQLCLLIARAAQKDSLGWWEDDSLTQAGGYVLNRLFPTDPIEAGRKLALEAAKTRYQAAIKGEDKLLHLFHLDETGEIEHGLHGLRLSEVDVPTEPITSLDVLRQSLIALVGEPPQFQIISERENHRLEIKPHSPVSNPVILSLAKIFCWATLEGKPGQPVFPYITMRL